MSRGLELLNFRMRVQEMTDASTLPLGSRLEELSCAESTADAESESSAGGDKLEAFLQITQQRRAQLLRLAKRYANSREEKRYANRREEAEDIVQEALLKAFRRLPQFRGDSKLGTWLGVIVLNVGREWLRKRKGRVFLPLEYVKDEDEDPIVFDLPDPGRDPEQCCEQEEMEEILLSGIDELNSACKSAIRMCALDGLTHVEAANALGVNVITIKSRIFRGKRMLRQRVCLRTGARNDLSQAMETDL
jgi:RNA polymerase sigma-70 factor (ECF subfamily)